VAKRGRGYAALVSAGVGVALVLIWWGAFKLVPNLVFRIDKPEGCNEIGCALSAALASVVLTIALVVAMSVALAWIILSLLGVRPALPVALLGPVLGFALALLISRGFEFVFGQSVPLLALAAAAGYGVAGLVTPKRA
jgi:hypothetical protein